MVSSAPSLSFNPATLDYGTINVGSSCAMKSYHVRNKEGSYAAAKNVSISYLGSYNASEPKTESWVYYSTALEGTYVTSIPGGKECRAPSVVQGYGSSINVRTKVKVPSDAATSGTVKFKAHHRYYYTG